MNPTYDLVISGEHPSDSPRHPVQRGPMQTDPAQRDPAHGDPNNRILVPPIQDNRWGFFNTLMKTYIVVEVFTGLVKYIFEGKKHHIFFTELAHSNL